MEHKFPWKGLLSIVLLHELSKRPLAGDQLAQAMAKRRGNPVTPGTIYPTLKRLKKRKMVTMKREGRRKVYTLTDTGKKTLKALYKELRRYFKGLKQHL